MRKILLLTALASFVLSGIVYAGCIIQKEGYYGSQDYKKYVDRSARTVNPHKKLTGYKGAFTCEKCHTGAIKEVMDSAHYQWKGAAAPNHIKKENGEFVKAGTSVGKRYKVGTIPNTYPMANMLGILKTQTGKTVKLGCGKCHTGGGFIPVPYTVASDEQKNAIDCLICHAANYDMKKRDIVATEKDGKKVLRLTADTSDKAYQSVGRPTSEACLRCHYHAGGGPAFKRGTDFADDTDIHAKKGVTCADCHVPRPRKGHGMVRGRDTHLWNYDSFSDEQGCIKCHSGKIHKEPRYDAEGKGRVACVTCHVKTTGGLMARDYTQLKQSKVSGLHLFKSKVTDEHSQPVVYKWWDGTTSEKFTPEGSFADGKSKLFIFKPFKETIFVDENDKRLATKNGLIFMKGGGPDKNGNGIGDIYEKAMLIAQKQGTFEWGKMQNPGVKKPPFAKIITRTEFLAVSHGVLPKEKSLQCADCHGKNPVISWKELGMDNPYKVK